MSDPNTAPPVHRPIDAIEEAAHRLHVAIRFSHLMDEIASSIEDTNATGGFESSVLREQLDTIHALLARAAEAAGQEGAA